MNTFTAESRKAYYDSVDAYWDEIESYRTALGLPEWCFDFISIHRCRDGRYHVMSPTCLINADSSRPSFEKHTFATFELAKVFAINVAKRHSTNVREIHVVSCCSQRPCELECTACQEHGSGACYSLGAGAEHVCCNN
jgi:hypothetical protein